MLEVTATASVLSRLEEYLSLRAVSPDTVFRSAQIDPAEIADPERFVSLATIIQLFEAAASATSDPCFAVHYAEAYPPGGSGVYGHVVLSAPTVGEMLELAMRYAELTVAPIELDRRQDERHTTFFINVPSPGTVPVTQFGLFLIAVMVLRVRRAAGPNWHPTRVSFTFGRPQPSALETYRGMFGPNLTFDASSFEVEVDSEVLRLPNPQTVVGLQATVQPVADKALDARREAVGFAGQVIQQIRKQLRDEAPLHLDIIAGALATTPRTMQLKLKQQDTTFEKLVGDVRERLAEELLRDSNLPLGEIAHRLGFAEPSGFTRWTKTHFHMPPSEYRERLRHSRTQH